MKTLKWNTFYILNNRLAMSKLNYASAPVILEFIELTTESEIVLTSIIDSL